MKQQGTVEWFSKLKGYGFIKPAGSNLANVFVHYSAIQGEGYRNLEPGQAVEFEAVDQGKGPQAQAVRVIQPEQQAAGLPAVALPQLVYVDWQE